MRSALHQAVTAFARGAFFFGVVGCRIAATPDDTSGGAGQRTNAVAADGNASDDDTTPSPGGTGGTASMSHPGSSGTTSGRSTAQSSDDAPSAGGSSARAGAGGEAEEGGSGAAGRADGAARGGTSARGSSAASPAGCDAQAVSLDEIRGAEVRSDVPVRVDATATSQKFLLSHAHSGSCLYGAFVGSDPSSDGPRGLLVVSYGDDAVDKDPCPTGTDAIPDDLSPGDAVRAIGYVASYAPSGCAATPSPQLMVERACPLERSARRAVPEPFTLSFEDADALALGTDAERVRRFAGGLVRLEQVSAEEPSQGNGSVGPYGVISLRETRLEIHNDIDYGDLSLGGPGDAAKALVFPYPTTFTSVTGLAYLDYCTWSLAPRSRCVDLTPPSDNCP
jgi:hypothetical protein